MLFFFFRKNNPELYSFRPSCESELQRAEEGSFISSVSTAGDWLVCGGGPAASLWNLSSRIMSGKLPPEHGGVFSTKIVEDDIYIGGQNASLHKARHIV